MQNHLCHQAACVRFLLQVVETLSRLHLVMEYAGGGELYTKITTDGKLSDSESKIVFAQIVSAVKHMVSVRRRRTGLSYEVSRVGEKSLIKRKIVKLV